MMFLVVGVIVFTSMVTDLHLEYITWV
ncbi:UNVERIFIED_CONTAM: hypothetical protein GTU68_016216 [Idotea baltica]|nr:hypothetical protein [Idotea baltica]